MKGIWGALTLVTALVLGSGMPAAAIESIQCDFDGDAKGDLAVGAPNEDVGAISNAGAVGIYYGAHGGPSTTDVQGYSQATAGILGTAATDDGFGASVACGDFNNDGFDDLAVGTPWDETDPGVTSGSVTIIYGSAGGLGTDDQLWSQAHPGILGVPHDGDLFGWALAVGDFNDDGTQDLAVGAPLDEAGSTVDGGAVNILYGSGSGLTDVGDQRYHQASTGIKGAAANGDLFGAALAAGDFNGNGVEDLAIGAPGANSDAGEAHILLATAAGGVTNIDRFFNQSTEGLLGMPEDGDYFGGALAAGDIGANGTMDLVIGVPGEDADAGAIQVLYNGLATDSQWWSQSSAGIKGIREANDAFGSALSFGDFNGDGDDDLAIGTPGDAVDTATNIGSVAVLLSNGTTLGSAGNERWSQNSSGIKGIGEDGDGFGFSLAAVDFDGEGHTDLAIGVPLEDIGALANGGYVAVLDGDANGGLKDVGDQDIDQSPVGAIEAGDTFGVSVGSLKA